MSFLCSIGLHKWENIRDPKGTQPIRYAGGCGMTIKVSNRYCVRCDKTDMIADQIRKENADKIARREAKAKELYGEE